MSRHGVMIEIDDENEVAGDRLERRWFACMHAASAKRAECEALLEVMSSVKASWHESRVELGKLEELRDALADAIANLAVERRALRELFAPAADRISTAA